MAESLVVSGLVSKRSELAGMIEHHMSAIRRLDAELHHLDATIKLFSPQYDLRTIRVRKYRQKNVYFKQGECARLALNVLREAGSPLATHVIALEIMQKKALDTGDSELVKFTKKATITALRHQANRGLVRDDGLASDGITLLWRLA